MGVDIPDTEPEKCVPIDEVKNFLISRAVGSRQVVQGAENELALSEMAQGKLSDHEGMRQNLSGVEEPREGFITGAQVIDPDRRIDQDHLASGRRRGIGTRSGSLPPRRA